MIFIEENEDNLFKHCQSIIDSMPRYQAGAKNSVKASIIFEPIYQAHIRNKLRDHLELIEQGLCDEEASSSDIGREVINLYSRLMPDQLTVNKSILIGNYVRLLLIRLACIKVIKLNSSFKITVQSQNQFKTVQTYRKLYPTSVFEALAIGTPERAIKHGNELPRQLIIAIEESSIAYKSRAGASLALARACLCQGVETLSDFKYSDWNAFYTDYISVPERPAISISALIGVLSKYKNDPQFSNEFHSNKSKKYDTQNNSEIDFVSGSRAQAIALLGEVNYLKNGVRYNVSERVEYFKSYNRKVISYGYWDSSDVKRSDFMPSNLDAKISQVWKVAQIDYCNTKREAGTRKNAELRLSVLNIYLFSYLPAYFLNCKTGSIKYPERPRDFISTIFVQRSSIFEYESKLPDDFQFPVSLEDFVHAYEQTRAKVGTSNENTAKGVMRDISLFFDHLVSICSTDSSSEFYIKSNPLRLAQSKVKGTKYIKSRKEVMSLTYWSGLRVFLKVVANKLLDDNLSIITSSYKTAKDLANYPINSKFSFFGTDVEIGMIDLTDVGTYWHRLQSGQNIRLPNANPIAMLSFMAYSGQRLSNTFWLDVNTYKILESDDREYEDGLDHDLVKVLINTDKALTKEFPIFIPLFTFNMLKKVENLLRLNKYEWSLSEIDYQAEEGSKWGKITPLFRTTEQHSSSSLPMASILAQYENCLTASGIKIEESQIFYMPAKHVSPTEHVYCVSHFKKHIDEINASVKYFDEEAVPFTPIKSGTLITPHSLRVMVSSVYSPALGEDVVSKLMTGQTEATVGYYTTELDSTSSDLIAHLSSLMNLSGKKIVSEASIDEVDFRRRLIEGTVELDYQASSMNFSPDATLDDETLPSSGLDALRVAAASALAFNRTHICPFNNDCPRSIISEIGEHSCSECPFTITTTNHIPSIAAEIRSKSERLKEIKYKLDLGNLNDIDRSNLERNRNSLLREVTNWYIRLKVISNNPDGLFIMSADGKKRLTHDTPITTDTSSLQAFLRRLDEVNGSDLLQTESLKIQSARFMRLAEINIDKVDWNSVPEYSDIDAAYNHFQTLCKVSSLDVKNTLKTIESKFSMQNMIVQKIGVQ
ncbi:hypothetical protein AEST_10130 [Alishewanella aestuarii B11]|uniref:Uncharacterized protein n=1 Tax=Alishewanella aestuarii B11 TaxID=1197174 RepID=J2IG37_9ALTE|nr:hypothetical protein [Alishewanella aestuarii]EJI86182.1 hypothetical protein AEST_10130 [Alishewanella aestuarii B11]